MKTTSRQLATSDPAKQPAPGSGQGNNDPAKQHQPDTSKPGSPSDPSKPHEPAKADNA